MSLRGVIRGRTIELDEPPPLPDGTRVEVDIKSPPCPDNPFWGRWCASADLIAEIEQTLMMARENTPWRRPDEESLD
jgi:hypothetical protein